MQAYKAISVGFLILGWLTRAAKDGRITAEEIGELLTMVIAEFGFNIPLPKELRSKDQITQAEPRSDWSN